VVLVYADDLGWGDLGVQGATEFRTPNLDRLAAEGTRFTAAYVPEPMCTPSRAGLLTGCHPMRLGLGYWVLFPYSDTGLHRDEDTLAESLGRAGYATGIVGKWHLGHHPPFLPTRQGFDEWFGIPYSNDMDGHHYARRDFTAPPLPLYRGEQVVEESPDQATLTRRFTDEAIAFVRRHRDRPFFLYLAHAMPHKPIHASPAYAGRTETVYGDVLEELDAGVGELVDVVDDLGLARRTLVLFASDNGPWRPASSGPLRGKKGTTWEGGVRVPLLARWPGHVPAGRVCAAPVSVLDVKPTVEALTGAAGAREVDGLDLSGLLRGREDARLEGRTLAFYRHDRLQAIRRGPYKLHLYLAEWKGEVRDPLLFDLDRDAAETRDLAAERPDLVAELGRVAEELRADLGDAVVGRTGTGVRPVGTLDAR